MAKVISFFIAVIVCVSLLGCQHNTESANDENISHQDSVCQPPKLLIDTATGSVAGNYIYHVASVDERHEIILKYNLVTGEVSPLCQDPYCDHTQETCPFYLDVLNDVQVTYIGDIVFYKTQDEDGKARIVAYDNAQMHSEVVYEGIYRVLEIFPYQYSLYYAIIENDVPSLYCYDTQSKSTKHVMTYESGSLYNIENDRIYIMIGKNIYNIYDLAGNRIEKADINDYRGYIYQIDDIHTTLGMRDMKFSYYRTKMGSTNREKIAEEIGPVQKINNSCVYFIPEDLDEQRLVYSTETEKMYDIFGGKVYIMDLDGSNVRLLCQVDDCDIKGLSGKANNKLTSGDWIGMHISKYAYNTPDNVVMKNTDLLLVNLVTGEYRVARYDVQEEIIR